MQVVGVEKIRVEDSAVDKRREVFAVLSDVETNKMVDEQSLLNQPMREMTFFCSS